MPEEVPAFVEQISKFSHIRVKGLMTIAPFVENPEDNRLFLLIYANYLLTSQRKTLIILL